MPTNLSSGAVYNRIAREMPGIEFRLANMSAPSLRKITEIVISDAKRSSPKKPSLKERLDPANFSRKVTNISGFIEEIPDSEPRSSMSGTGRPAQLYRRGKVERLEPPLRLKVKRNSARDDS